MAGISPRVEIPWCDKDFSLFGQPPGGAPKGGRLNCKCHFQFKKPLLLLLL